MEPNTWKLRHRKSEVRYQTKPRSSPGIEKVEFRILLRFTVAATKLEHDRALRPQTKDKRTSSMRHAATMFPVFGVYFTKFPKTGPSEATCAAKETAARCHPFTRPAEAACQPSAIFDRLFPTIARSIKARTGSTSYSFYTQASVPPAALSSGLV